MAHASRGAQRTRGLPARPRQRRATTCPTPAPEPPPPVPRSRRAPAVRIWPPSRQTYAARGCAFTAMGRTMRSPGWLMRHAPLRVLSQPAISPPRRQMAVGAVGAAALTAAGGAGDARAVQARGGVARGFRLGLASSRPLCFACAKTRSTTVARCQVGARSLPPAISHAKEQGRPGAGLRGGGANPARAEAAFLADVLAFLRAAWAEQAPSGGRKRRRAAAAADAEA